VREEELRKAVAEIEWWHTIDLGHGIVTPGKDNSPEKLRFLRMPERLDDRSVLDIGAWDGFFSFEAERRGAARVLATDSFAWEGTNVGSKEGFELARRALSSKVEDRHIDPTELSPEAIGTFDVVLFLGVLYHLRDPLGVLERVASVTAPGGLCIVETFVDLLHVRQPAAAFYPFAELNDDPTNWFGFNPAGADAALRAVGFSRVERVGVDRDAGGSVRRFITAAGMAGARLKRRDRPVLAPLERGRLVLHAYKQ
jgi:tRNA (mo5U34)-methyltransferase